MSFLELCEWLKRCEEIEFGYLGKEYSFLNNYENGISYWYFLCNEMGIHEKICIFEDTDTLIDFVKNYSIQGVSLQKIFDDGLAE